MIIQFLQETGGKAVEAEINYFKELLNGQISGFVEEELQPYFGSLISFIKRLNKEKILQLLNQVLV